MQQQQKWSLPRDSCCCSSFVLKQGCKYFILANYWFYGITRICGAMRDLVAFGSICTTIYVVRCYQIAQRTTYARK